MNEVKTAKFTLTASEVDGVWRSFMRRGHRRRWILSSIGVLVLAAFLIGVPILSLSSVEPGITPRLLIALSAAVKRDQLSLWTLEIVVAATYFFGPQYGRWMFRRAYRANRMYLEDLEIGFSDEGVDVNSRLHSMHCLWGYYQSFVDLGGYVLLVHGGDRYLTVPKRAVDPTQLPALIDLLRRHISMYEVRK